MPGTPNNDVSRDWKSELPYRQTETYLVRVVADEGRSAEAVEHRCDDVAIRRGDASHCKELDNDLIETLIGSLADGLGEVLVHARHVAGRNRVLCRETVGDAAERSAKVGNEMVDEIASGGRIGAKVDLAGIVLAVEPTRGRRIGVELTEGVQDSSVNQGHLVGERIGAKHSGSVLLAEGLTARGRGGHVDGTVHALVAARRIAIEERARPSEGAGENVRATLCRNVRVDEGVACGGAGARESAGRRAQNVGAGAIWLKRDSDARGNRDVGRVEVRVVHAHAEGRGVAVSGLANLKKKNSVNQIGKFK